MNSVIVPGPWKVSGPGSNGGWYAVQRQPHPRRGPFSTEEAAQEHTELLNREQAVREAAPDLLALAHRVVEIFGPMQAKGQNGDTFERLLKRAEAIIAKVEGT